MLETSTLLSNNQKRPFLIQANARAASATPCKCADPAMLLSLQQKFCKTQTSAFLVVKLIEKTFLHIIGRQKL